MRKLKAIATGIAAVFVLAAAPVAFVAANDSNPQTGPGVSASGTEGVAALDCKRLSAANSAGQEIFLNTTNPKTYLNAGGAWQNVECTSTTFRLKFGERALVTADFSAEADCNGTTPTNGQWCEARALLNNVEGQPMSLEPDSFAFDGVAGGTQNWQAHSMQRGWETTRCLVTTGCPYRFVVQTQMHNATVSSLWLDEVAVDLKVTIGAPAPL